MNSENQLVEQLPKSERRRLRRQQKMAEQAVARRDRQLKKASRIVIWVVALVLGVGGLIWFFSTRTPLPEEEIISRTGLHWHPRLEIYLNGQKQEIPANIGIGVKEEQIHTHDTTGEIHLEFVGRVTKDDIRLGKFFRIWSKRFNQNCIFEFCNDGTKKVRMFVGGKENPEFENYLMRDGDRIEIRYE